MKNIFSRNTSVDQIVSSFNDGDYIIISGKPGAGTITLGTKILTNIAIKNKNHIQFISLKDGADTIINDLKKQAMDMYGIDITETTDSPFMIDTVTAFQPNISVINLFINNRKDSNCKIAFIDCISLINHPEGIKAISEQLRTFAKENGIMIMAASTTPPEMSKELNPDVLIITD